MKNTRKPVTSKHNTCRDQKVDVDIVDWLLAIDLDASAADKRAYYAYGD